ncbi:MAG: efflux RND transporter permease subunit [Alphaproteobacteria bacterium]|nr:efflux RND transporter permease subunit [Alphaproteobacteria bacterium]
MIKFFVKNPVTTVMFVLFFVVLGIVSFPKMNVESRPSVDFPFVTAMFVYPGASPSEIESQVIKRTEDAISEIAGIKKISSQAFENGAHVMAEFNLGVNVNDKSAEVKAKLDALANEFPEAMRKPVVEKLDPLQESVIDIVISGGDAKVTERFVSDVLSQQITSLPGVASVSVFGGINRAVRVSMNPELLAARGATVFDIVGALGASNLNVPGGRLESGVSSNAVRFVGEFSNVDDIKNLQISTTEGALFKLRDVATVTDGALDIETGARFNGEDVLILSVVKANDGNAIKISRDLRKNMDRFQGAMSEYFAGQNMAAPVMQIISDSSIAVQHETDGTVRDIILGLFLTVIVLLVFTRNWRTTIIAGIMIPASLVAGFYFMDASGFSINAMTLLAMATALGTLITDAIILIESALGLIEEGYSPEDAAVIGTKKVAVRIFATVLTHAVVFLPLAFMGGIAGQFMQQFGLSVVYLTVLSSIFSFTLTPMMIAKILKKKKPQDLKTKKTDSKQKAAKREPLAWFRPFFDWQINHPWRAVGVAALALVISVIPMRWVGNEFAPSTDMNEITMTVRGPSNSTFAKSEEVVKEIESRLSGFSDIEYVSAKIGERGLQNINMKIGLVPRSGRHDSDKVIARKILPAVSDIPGIEVTIRAGQAMSGASNADMVLNVYGADDAKRLEYADTIIEVLNNIPEIQSAMNSAPRPGMEFKFVPTPENMKFWGVNNQTAGTALRTALFGNDSYKYKEEGQEYPIMIEFDKAYKTGDMFESIFVATPKGLVALGEIGKIESGMGTSDIRRVDKERITEINIVLGKSTIGPVQKKIEAELSKIEFASGYRAAFGGMSEIQAESSSEMGRAFLLATILTFMVLAAILNSLVHPFTIATSILTSFVGVFILMFLVGANINIAAMLSVIMLVGLSVSTNILILEPTLEEMRKGVPATKALWEQFVDKKRMLLMATIAVVAGLVPQLWAADGVKVSMGAVIIGGILASLFWTFFLTPAVFTLMERVRKKN